eukprot:gene18249-biopygen8393
MSAPIIVHAGNSFVCGPMFLFRTTSSASDDVAPATATQRCPAARTRPRQQRHQHAAPWHPNGASAGRNGCRRPFL